MVTQLASYPTDPLSGRLRENARPARPAVDTALRERSDFPGVEALATLKRQCLSPRCSDELASKSRVSSRRAGSAKTVGELTSKGLFSKRAGGYLGQRAWALPSASAPPAGALACLPASWGTLVPSPGLCAYRQVGVNLPLHHPRRPPALTKGTTLNKT